MYFVIAFFAAVFFVWLGGWLERKSVKPIGEQSTTVSWAVTSAEDAEDMFFNGGERIKLYYFIEEGIVSYFLDQSFEQKALNGFYCDGFYILTITDNSVEAREL